MLGLGGRGARRTMYEKGDRPSPFQTFYMHIRLNLSEARALGCLIEKRLSTPGNYPLTLNSLVTACNQSSNRHPIVKYDQHIVNEAMVNTRNQGLSLRLSKSGSRTAKFDEKLSEKLGLNDKQAAVLAELLLRGPQTPGELRQRTTRMVDFPDLEVLEKVLENMASQGTEPIIVKLPKQPGRREARYAHTLCGPVDVEAFAQEEAPQTESGTSLKQRVSDLESQVAELTKRLEILEELR
jgi:uncharacterized protein